MALKKARTRRNSGFPIIVGIVGHRDPANPDRIAACIQDGLEQIVARWPDSDIVGLSPLADGVDRVFARVLLESGHRLRVVLPMPLTRYTQDFDAASRAEFEELMSSAELVTQAPPVAGMGPGDDLRVAEYVSAGFYVAQCSHILFAGWDGRLNGLQAGTAHIVHARLSGIYDRFADPDGMMRTIEADLCPASHMTYLIKTERIKEDLSHPTIDMEVDAAWGISLKMLHKSAQRGRLSDFTKTEALDQMVRMGKRLRLDAHVGDNQDGLALLQSLRTASERNADRYVTRERSRVPVLLLLACVALASFAVYGEFYDMIPSSWMLLVVYAVALGLIAVVARSQRVRLTTSDPTGWRRLSEALRVFIAWHRAGVSAHWSELQPRAQLSLTQRDDWVDCVIRGHMIGYKDPSEPDRGLRDLAGLESEWIDDQIKYFRGKESQTARFAAFRQLGGVAFAIGILCVFASGYFVITETTGSFAERIVWFLAGIFPATGALLSGYATVMEQTSPSSVRDRMLLLYAELKHRVEIYRRTSAPSETQTRRLRQAILSVGRAALGEVQDWSQLTSEAIRKVQDLGR